MIERIEVEGVDKLIADFKRFGKEADKAVKRGVDRTALAVETDAKQKLLSDGHVDTRRLLQSIHTETQSNQRFSYKDKNGMSFNGSLNEQMKPDESIAGTNVHYAPYVEFGTSKMSGDSYLGYAAVKQDKKLRDRIIE